MREEVLPAVQAVFDSQSFILGAIVKVIFENDFLRDDQIKVQLCRICDRLGAEFVKTSTGYGFIKGADGKYYYKGVTEKDLKLMRSHVSPRVKLKAVGGIRDLDTLLRYRKLGVARVGATATEEILEEYKRRLAGKNPPLKKSAKAKLP